MLSPLVNNTCAYLCNIFKEQTWMMTLMEESVRERERSQLHVIFWSNQPMPLRGWCRLIKRYDKEFHNFLVGVKNVQDRLRHHSEPLCHRRLISLWMAQRLWMYKVNWMSIIYLFSSRYYCFKFYFAKGIQINMQN